MKKPDEIVSLEFHESFIQPEGNEIKGFNRNNKTIAIFNCNEKELGRMLWTKNRELKKGQYISFGGYRRKVINHCLLHNVYNIECTDPRQLRRAR
jgi:hypothetical protein